MNSSRVRLRTGVATVVADLVRVPATTLPLVAAAAGGWLVPADCLGRALRHRS